MQLHLDFIPDSVRGASRGDGPDRKKEIAAEREAAQQKQIEEVVALIRSHRSRIDQARAAKQKYRIAVLGRARKSLSPSQPRCAKPQSHFARSSLKSCRIVPRSSTRSPLARALLNPHDRVAWLGVLRAPWCGLSLADLHTLTSADSPELLARPVPELLSERSQLLSDEGREGVERVLQAVEFSERLRSQQPTASLGTLA